MAAPHVGDPAPDFELEGTGGKRYRLSEYRGRKVVLVFYPGDFTPVCTRQMCAYRDGSERFETLGVEVLGISAQGIESHESFRDKHGLTVPLLADEDKSVARAYGVLGLVGQVRRGTFIVDEEGRIAYRHMPPLVGTTYKSVDELEEALAAI